MATYKIQKNRMNEEGTYDVIHYETDASIVLMPDGSSVAEAIESRVDGTSKQIKATLPASAWTGDAAPFTLTLNVEGISANMNGDLALSQDATAEQREAARNAMIAVTEQVDGAITVVADGEKPAVDLPVVITIFPKAASEGDETLALEQITAHIEDKNNPHGTTAEEIGAALSDLSNVSNEDMRAKVEESGFSGAGVHISADEPTDENVTVWIDTDEETAESYYTTDEVDAKFATKDYALARDGSNYLSSLNIRAYDNGYSRIAKNHSATADYGTQIQDINKDNVKAKLIIDSNSDAADQLRCEIAGVERTVLHSGNISTYAAPAKAVDVSSAFTPNSGLISSSSISAYKLGDMLFFSCYITPIELYTIQNTKAFDIASGYRPAKDVASAATVIFDITNAKSERTAVPCCFYTTGFAGFANQGGLAMSITTKSVINMTGCWKIGG